MTDEEEYEQSVKENADDPLALFCLAMFKEPMTAERLEAAAESLTGGGDDEVEKAKREGYMLARKEVLARLDSIALDSTSAADGLCSVVDYMDELRRSVRGESDPRCKVCGKADRELGDDGRCADLGSCELD